MRLLALPLAAACVAPPVDPDWDAVQADCAAELAAWTPTTAAVDLASAMSAPCATTLGASVGLAWNDFGFNAEHLGRSDVGAYTLAALLTVAADDTRDVAWVLSDPDLPPVAIAPLDALRTAYDLDDDAPAGALWLAWLRAAFTATNYAADLGQAAADFSVEKRRVRLTPRVLGTFATGIADADLPPRLGAVLVHEATHLYVTHVACERAGGVYGCDATPDGAYGMGAWWLTDWLLGHDDARVDPRCIDLENTKEGYCMLGIEEATGWPPCDRVCE